MGRNTVPAWALTHLRAHLPADAPLVNVRKHARGVVVGNTHRGAVVVTKARFGTPQMKFLANPRGASFATCPDCGMQLEFRHAMPSTLHCGQCGRALTRPQETRQPVPTPARASLTTGQAQQALAEARESSKGDPKQMRTALHAALSSVAAPQVEAEVARLQEMKRTFINSAAHELQTPMTPLLLSLRTLEMQEPKPQGNQALQHVVRSAKRLEDVIARLLKVSQVQAGRLQVLAAPVDLRETVRKALATWQPKADAAGIHLRTRLAPLQARADDGKVLELLDHLLSNAIRFTPSGGQVTVSLRKARGLVELTVADTGPGIPSGDRARVLEPFVQLEPTHPEAGLGLGLFFANAIMQAHGGTLRLEGEPGTRVVAAWPAHASFSIPRRPNP